MDAREALLKARELFLKIGNADDVVARQAAAEFRVLMDEWGITLENMYRFTREKWRPIASRAIDFWRESQELSGSPDPKYQRPKNEREAWILWQNVENTLEMIAALNLSDRPEDDTHYREVYYGLSRELKRLVETGKCPRDMNNDSAFKRWRADWDY